jgi:hypothetical protein
MQLYGIRRRNWWKDADDMAAGGARSKEVGDEEGSGVRWIRSYVLPGGRRHARQPTASTRRESPEALRAHAEKSGFGA